MCPLITRVQFHAERVAIGLTIEAAARAVSPLPPVAADGSITLNVPVVLKHRSGRAWLESARPSAPRRRPDRILIAALRRAHAELAKAVTDDLGGQGLFGVELFVKGDAVWFSEVSPRPHDTGLVTLATQVQSEFELHARAILGLPVNTALRSPGASAVIYGGMDAQGIAFDGVDEALRVPNTDLRLFGKPESFVKRRMGVALAFDADVEVARERAKLAAGKVRPRKA